MEVHHHAHTARKKWTHYFWEFLMLFLAVFCGFLAENQREHYIEHQREKQFMKTLLHDLQNDTASFGRSIHLFQNNVDRFDSLKASIKNPTSAADILNAYKAATLTHSFSSFNYSDRTIEQLRNAGNFRLIRKTHVSDSLIEYDRYIRNTYLTLQHILEQNSLKVLDIQNEIFDYDDFNFLMGKNWQARQAITPDSFQVSLQLLNNNQQRLAYYYNTFAMYRNWWQRMANHSKYSKRVATSLIDLVKKEYHLK